jgi:alpha-glucosidase
VAESARKAIEIRYKLLDYIYTAHYIQNQTGAPLIQPMFFHYPTDPNTFPLGFQYFYGPGLLVAPVTRENSTTTDIYLPDDLFYDYYTHAPVRGTGASLTLSDVDYTTIPLYYTGGHIFPQRVASANTTTELRTLDFELVIAPDAAGTAQGDLYLDDGESLVQPATSLIHFEYAAGVLSLSGRFDYQPGVGITKLTVLGGGAGEGTAAGGTVSRVADVMIPLTGAFSGPV